MLGGSDHLVGSLSQAPRFGRQCGHDFGQMNSLLAGLKELCLYVVPTCVLMRACLTVHVSADFWSSFGVLAANHLVKQGSASVKPYRAASAVVCLVRFDTVKLSG